MKEGIIDVAKWLEQAKADGPPSLMFILVGNKSDKMAEYIFKYVGEKSLLKKD